MEIVIKSKTNHEKLLEVVRSDTENVGKYEIVSESPAIVHMFDEKLKALPVERVPSFLKSVLVSKIKSRLKEFLDVKDIEVTII